MNIICINMHICIIMQIYAYMCIYTHMYMHIYMNIYIYMHIYVCIIYAYICIYVCHQSATLGLVRRRQGSTSGRPFACRRKWAAQWAASSVPLGLQGGSGTMLLLRLFHPTIEGEQTCSQSLKHGPLEPSYPGTCQDLPVKLS